MDQLFLIIFQKEVNKSSKNCFCASICDFGVFEWKRCFNVKNLSRFQITKEK